ncbi:MAG: anthranilate phosphoribosyltransferase [Mariprofundaceae bacterium]|nr:anthranilate phosphoribosyltransferase [Mariprofundaceae bacterium]
MTYTIQQAIADTQKNIPLNSQQAELVFTQIMQGEATSAQIAALLMGLSINGETADLLAGAALAMRGAATKITPKATGMLDTCGTGGDGASTFNISTTVALVLAACGVPVAKHGNRAISSKSGSADVLEALGVKLDIAPEQVANCIDEVGIGFLFAPQCHPAMRYAGPVRREMGVRSVFNLLGPLTNPAGADYQVLGVFGEDKLDLVAGALAQLGCKRALVVHGRDGLDEITTTAITDAVWVENGNTHRFEIDPAAFGLPYATPTALQGGDAALNADIIKHILAGVHGAGRDIVLLNSAAALWVAGKVESIADGLGQVAEVLDSGKATATLEALIAFTNRPNPDV